jgi:hypothetical protein
MNYRFAYAVGFHPWEDAEGDPPFAKRISEIFDREESGRWPPYGPALDLGTGSGIWGYSWQSGAGRSQVSTSSRRPCGARPTG